MALLLPALSLAPAHAAAKCLGHIATIVGTTADNELTGTKAADVIVGLGGDDTISGLGGNDLLCGGGGADVIFGYAGRDTVSGDAGADQLSGGPGHDSISGGNGDDFVNYHPSSGPVHVDLLNGVATGEGTDELSSIESIFGSIFDDQLIGSDKSNVIEALDGDDEVRAGGGVDLIYDGVGLTSQGTDGDDVSDGGASYDAVVFSFSPNPVVVDLEAGSATGDGTDQLIGIEGVWGSPFGDDLKGDDGLNLFLGRGGDDTIDGRGGGDAAAFWFAPSGVTADLTTNSASGFGEGTDEIVNIEALLGSVGFTDHLTGDDHDNLLDGDGANDTIIGGGGNDWLVGGTGDDDIDGGLGEYDLADYSNTAFLETVAAVRVDLGVGSATGQGTDDISGIEAVMGSSLDDRLTGDAVPNFLFGNDGHDTLDGLAGDDFLDGGVGPDTASGGDGLDNCIATSSVSACEGSQAAPQHPVLEIAGEIARVRRLIRRHI